jgi:hypothetical protein
LATNSQAAPFIQKAGRKGPLSLSCIRFWSLGLRSPLVLPWRILLRVASHDGTVRDDFINDLGKPILINLRPDRRSVLIRRWQFGHVCSSAEETGIDMYRLLRKDIRIA